MNDVVTVAELIDFLPSGVRSATPVLVARKGSIRPER